MTCQPPITTETIDLTSAVSEQVGFVQLDFFDVSANALQNTSVNFNTTPRTDQVSDQVSDYVGDQVESLVCRVFRHTAEGSLKTSTFHFGNSCDIHCGG